MKNDRHDVPPAAGGQYCGFHSDAPELVVFFVAAGIGFKSVFLR
ncbi:hypothetical protein ACFS4T_17855 [Pseudomonas lini]